MARRDFTDSSESGFYSISTGKPLITNSREALGKRIRYFRKKANLQTTTLASKLGISKNSITNWESGIARPDIDNLLRMCDIFDITPSQLLGVATDLSATEKHLIRLFRSLNGLNQDFIVDSMKRLLEVQNLSKRTCPKLTLVQREFKPLAAGFGDPYEYFEAGERVYVHADALPVHVDYIFNVNGDSMEPTYQNGDMVMVQVISIADMVPGMVGAFQKDNELFIKEYQRIGLISHNPNYAPMLFTDNADVFLIGKVVGTLNKADLATPEEISLFEELSDNETDKETNKENI